MHATRQRILEVLQELGSGTAKDLADRLRIKLPSLRYHVLALEESDLIARVPPPASGHVGRPAVTYALTPQGVQEVQHCTPWLVKSLLGQMRTRSSPDELDTVYREMGYQLAQVFKAGDLARLPFADRLEQASRALSHRGYGATVKILDRGEQSETVLQTHICPYGELPHEYAELCQMDLELVSELVGQPCTQEQFLSQGDPCCTFRVPAPGAIDLDLT